MISTKFGSDVIKELRDNEHNIHPRVWERLTVHVRSFLILSLSGVLLMGSRWSLQLPPASAVKNILIEVASKNSLAFTPEENERFLACMVDETPTFGFGLGGGATVTHSDAGDERKEVCSECPTGIPTGIPPFPGTVVVVVDSCFILCRDCVVLLFCGM